MSEKPRLLVLNQYYWPGLEATAYLLSQLLGALSDDFDVTVVTGRLAVHAPHAERVVHDGVKVVRVRSSAFDRSGMLGRGMNYATYLLQALRVGLLSRRPDVVLCMTDPPMVGDVAIAAAKRFGVPLLVISEDVFPEIATKLRRLENPVLVGVLRQLVRLYLKRADRVVAIGETMRARLEAKGTPGDRLRVIPNWIDTNAITPREHENEWKQRQKLAGKFVVMHSGNVGHAQDLDVLVRSATFLRDLDDLKIVIVGFGARHAEILSLAARLETDQVRFLPYQPRDMLPLSLAAGSLHFVGLARGLSGYVVPSRLYGILAAGRPVIVSAEPDSETAQVVSEVGCGVVLPPGRPELVARAIRDAHDGKLDLEAMGMRGREYVTAEADRAVAVGRYRSVLQELRR